MISWTFDSENNGNVILKRSCTNKTSKNACSTLPTSKTTTTITPKLSTWDEAINKDLSGNVTRTCTDNSYYSIIPISKPIISTKLRKYPPGPLTKVDDWKASISGIVMEHILLVLVVGDGQIQLHF